MCRSLFVAPALVVVGLVGDARPARACEPALALTFSADPAAQATDHTPPGKARVPWVRVWEPPDGGCNFGTSTTRVWAEDDTTPTAELGWIVTVEQGALPSPTTPVQAQFGDIYWSWSMGDGRPATVDAVIVVRAMDRAGNIGPPSDPVAVHHGPERDLHDPAVPIPGAIAPTSRDSLEDACRRGTWSWEGSGPCELRAEMALREADLLNAQTYYHEACVLAGGASSTCDLEQLIEQEASGRLVGLDAAAEYQQRCTEYSPELCARAQALIDAQRAIWRRRQRLQLGAAIAAVVLVAGVAAFAVARGRRRRQRQRQLG